MLFNVSKYSIELSIVSFHIISLLILSGCLKLERKWNGVTVQIQTEGTKDIFIKQNI